MKFFKPIFAALMLFAVSASATTNTAANASWIAVSNAFAISLPGDTVLITNTGSANWSNSIISTNVSLIGPGTNSLTIFDAVTNTANGYNRDFLLQVHAGGTSGSGVTTVSGITFAGKGIGANGYNRGRIFVDYIPAAYYNQLPTNAPVIFRDCVFSNLMDVSITYDGGTVGVVHGNTFFLNGNGTGVKCFGKLHDPLDLDWGDWSWFVPAPWGSTNAVYVENNYFTNSEPGTGTSAACIDGWAGGGIVFRYNTVWNDYLSNHGAESSNYRSGRFMEIYGNKFSTPAGNGRDRVVNVRGGSGVCFSNVVTNYTSASIITFSSDRQAQRFASLGGEDGFCALDLIAGTNYTSGTHNGGNGSNYLINSGATWTVNQFVGYTVNNLDFTNTDGSLRANNFSIITTNSATQIFYVDSKDTISGLIHMVWTNGNRYVVNKVTRGMDETGAGSGDLLRQTNGTTLARTNVTAGGVGWPHQASEPWFVWGNTVQGAANNSSIGNPTLVPGRDYTNDVAKPSYTPLVYPHPLISTNGGGGGGGTPGVTYSAPVKVSAMIPATNVLTGDLFYLVRTNPGTGSNNSLNVTATLLKSFFTPPGDVLTNNRTADATFGANVFSPSFVGPLSSQIIYMTTPNSDNLLIQSYDDSTVHFTASGGVYFDNGNLNGNGAGLIGLDASQLSANKFPVARSPGITTNMQFTFSSQRTNTMYFTNGILMKVTQP